MRPVNSPQMSNVAANSKASERDATRTYEVGLGLMKHTRRLLEEMRFAGWKLTWLEGRGRISRPFTIRARPEVIAAFDHELRRRFPVDAP